MYKRLLTDGNVSKLRHKLSNIEWDNVLQGANVNDDYDIFLKTFTETYNDCIPTKKCVFNGWQLAKMKKSIPDMSLP